jgi:Mor family transcriptional regulator
MIYPPPNEQSREELDERNRQIKEAYALGHSPTNIAAKYNITRERVYQIVKDISFNSDGPPLPSTAGRND